MVGMQSTIKSTLLRKRVLASLMLTGVLVTCAGLGQTVQADDGKIYASGGNHTYTVTDSMVTDKETGAPKQVTNHIIGGWEYQDGEINDSKQTDIPLDQFTNHTDKDKTAHTTINSGTFAGVIGGDFLREPSQNVTNLAFGESAITINGGRVGESIGGDTPEATFDEAIVGGNKISYFGSTSANSHQVEGITAQTTTDKTTVTLTGGLVNAPIFAGSMIMNNGQYTQASQYIVNDHNTNLILQGGAVNNYYGQAYQNYIDEHPNEAVAVTYTTNEIYGGGAVIGAGRSQVGNANIVVDGFGDDAHYVEVFGGSLAAGGGTATVENTTITLRNVKNIGVVAGGKVLSGNFQVPTLVNGTWQATPLFEGIDKFANVDTSTIHTQSIVENATINMESGQVWMMWLGGEAPENDFVPGTMETLRTDNVTLNYQGGSIGEITLPSSTATATVNLNADMNVNTITLQASETPNPNTPDMRIVGNGHALTGDIITSQTNRVMLDNLSSYTGTLAGDGEIDINSDWQVTEHTIFDGSNIHLEKGNLHGVYNLKQNVTINEGNVTITDFAKDFVPGSNGQFILNGGSLTTTASQLYGATAGDSTATTTNGKVLPVAVDAVADNRIDFQSGSVVLTTDTGYTLDYANAATQAVQQADSGNAVKVVMTGKLLDSKVTLDTIKKLDNRIVLDSVTVDGTNAQDPNLIIKGTNESLVNSGSTLPIETVTHDATVLTKGFQAGALNLKSGSTGVIISGHETLGLGGTQGGKLITVAGKTPDPDMMTISVGTGSPDANAIGTLQIGNEATSADTEYVLPAAVEVRGQSAVITRGTVTVRDGILMAAGGLVEAQKGSITSDVYVTSGGTGVIAGTMVIPKLELEAGEAGNQPAALQLGFNGNPATVTVNEAMLNGAAVMVDPAWGSQASELAINFTKTNMAKTTNIIDGMLLIGQNTYATIGDSLAAKDMFKNTGLTFDEQNITAVLYLKGNQELGGKGVVYVDGAKTDSQLAQVSKEIKEGSYTADFTAGANSLTMVDGAATTAKAALRGVKEVAIDQNAKLYIHDAQGGNTYHILVNDGTHVIEGIDSNHWTNANIITNKSYIELTGVYDGNTAFDVTAVTKKTDDIYDDKDTIDDIGDAAIRGDNQSAAYKFFTNAMDSTINTTTEAQLDALNSMANMTGLSGITLGAYTTSNVLSDSAIDHVSLVHPFTHDKDVWARLVQTKDSVDGLALGGMQGSFDNKYNGIVVGADLYQQGHTTAGVAMSYLDGSTSGHTVVAATSTDSKYYGLSLYGRVDTGAYALLGDVSYMHGSHDITQYNSGMKVTGSTDTDAVSLGIRGERRMTYGEATFVPYIGARYVHLSIGDYTNSIGLHYDQSDRNLFLLPVGVKYSAAYARGAWTYRPVAEVGYVWNLGGRAVDQTVSLDGTTNGFTYDVTDHGSFIGKVGLEATKGDITYGLSYEYQKGSHVQSNRYDAKINFRF